MPTLRFLKCGLAIASLFLAGTIVGRADEPSQAPLAAGIEVPEDPVEKAAFDVLTKHCSRCHQAGMLLGRDKPAHGFGNVLKLDDLAADPNLIQPGNPEGSSLFIKMSTGQMPADLADFTRQGPEVTKEDVGALRDWVLSLKDVEARNCKDRKFIRSEQIVKYIVADLDHQQKERLRGMRYLTLTNLYNACESDAALDVYRQAAIKLLNSLGRRSSVVRLTTIDPARTILSFNLDDLGWRDTDWNSVLAVYPYATRPDVSSFDFAAQATYTVLPYVRADWFTNTASQPPLYDRLLELPDTFAQLGQKLGVDVTGDIDNNLVQRAGFQISGVSKNNRLIERHASPTGYFWTSYDFATSSGDQSLFLHPLGPGGQGAFKPDGGETIFTLPNGFQGYFLNNGEGARIDKGLTQIVNDPARRDGAVTNGVSCMGCHDAGMKKAKDEIRRAITADHGIPIGTRDQVKALYPEGPQMDDSLAQDQTHFTSAMTAAGLKVDTRYNGVEMVNALFKRYEDNLSMRRAAAEFGYLPEDFRENLQQSGDVGVQLYRRLDQGTVPRDQFEGLFPQLVATATDETPIDVSNLDIGARTLAVVPKHGAPAYTPPAAAAPAVQAYTPPAATPSPTPTYTPPAVTPPPAPAYVEPVAAPPPPAPANLTFYLALTSDKSKYKANDNAVLTIQSTRDCYLTLVDIDQKGVATVLLPNDYQRDNHIKAGDIIHFPGADAGYSYQVAPTNKGAERIMAVCDMKQKNPLSIVQDYKASGFTEIPDFVSRTLVVKPVKRPDATDRAQAAILFTVN